MMPFLPTVREIAEKWGLAVSNTHRILGKMVEFGMVEKRETQYYAFGGHTDHVKFINHGVQVIATLEISLIDAAKIGEHARNQRGRMVTR